MDIFFMEPVPAIQMFTENDNNLYYYILLYKIFWQKAALKQPS